MAIDQSLRQDIQTAYSTFLQQKSLTARYGQKLMIAEIARALSGIEMDEQNMRSNHAGIAAIEAGTGTGKTVAYILGALPFAWHFKKTIIVSTATITLQSQIIEKDLPDILKHSGLTFRFGLAKGRRRYLCLSKLENVREAQNGVLASLPLFEDGLSADQQALKFFDTLEDTFRTGTWNGDKDNLEGEVDDKLWSFVTATHRECSNRRCPNFKDCAYFKARQDLEAVDIIVANHDLVLADLALGGGAVLPAPADSIYILDEAHHLADKALSHFSSAADIRGSLQWLEQWRKTQRRLEADLSDAASLRPIYVKNEQLLTEAEARLRDLWLLTRQVSEFVSDGGSQYDQPIHRFPHGVVPDSVRELTAVLRILFSSLLAGFDQFDQAFKKALADDNSEITKAVAERWFAIVGTYHLRCEGILALFRSFATKDDAKSLPMARWVEQRIVNGEEDLRLQASPILAASTLESAFWNTAFGAILTSATLTAAASFDRLKMQAGVPDWATFKQVPSPFKFFECATFIVPTDAVDASHPILHTRSIITMAPSLLHAENGTLMLFSSRRQMNEVMEGLDPATRELCLIQNQSARHQLIRTHKERIDAGKRSCLVGLASFAEGVDLPGKYLQTVIIAKLPFSTPDNPIDASLAEWIEARGGNAFMQITLPEASIKLVQSCGRLIRTETDKGTIYLLDNRVYTKRYGQLLLDSLPPFRRSNGKDDGV